MTSYLVKRVILIIPLLFGVTALTFGLAKALPGDPVYSLIGERA